MGIAQVRQRFRRDVASVAGLAIDDNVFVKPRTDLPMAYLDLPEINVEIGAGNKTSAVLLNGTNVDQDKTLLRHGRSLRQPGAQLLNRQQVGMMGRYRRHRRDEHNEQAEDGDGKSSDHDGPPDHSHGRMTFDRQRLSRL